MVAAGTYHVKGLKQLQAALKNQQVVNNPVKRFLERSALVVEGRAKEKAPVDTGRLRSSISRSVQPARRQARVGSKVSYARKVEEGAPPGTWPPKGALQPWARRHGFPAGDSGDFLVRRAIFRKGTPAQPYLLPALRESQRDIQGFLRDLSRDIKTEFRRANRRL